MLPSVPAGDPSIHEAYRELSAKGQVLYVRGVAVTADNLVPNDPSTSRTGRASTCACRRRSPSGRAPW